MLGASRSLCPGSPDTEEVTASPVMPTPSRTSKTQVWPGDEAPDLPGGLTSKASVPEAYARRGVPEHTWGMTQGAAAVNTGHPRTDPTGRSPARKSSPWTPPGAVPSMAYKGSTAGSILPCQAGRYDARHLCLEAGVAHLVVVGEGGACRCPFGVRRQQRVGRLSGTTALPPSHDTTHPLTNPRGHLFPRLACYGARVSSRV
jgi:hypothetical protein